MRLMAGPGAGVRGPAGRPPGVPDPSHPEDPMQQQLELAAYYAEEAPSLRRSVAAAVTAAVHRRRRLLLRLDPAHAKPRPDPARQGRLLVAVPDRTREAWRL